MKHIQAYETINNGQPKVGDYVLCDEISSSTKEYTRNNVGKIIFIIDESNMQKYRLFDDFKYIIRYEYKGEIIDSEITQDEDFFDGYCRRMKSEEIIYWSSDKRELNAILKSNKYNL
jgi:hypothetical protein